MMNGAERKMKSTLTFNVGKEAKTCMEAEETRNGSEEGERERKEGGRRHLTTLYGRMNET